MTEAQVGGPLQIAVALPAAVGTAAPLLVTARRLAPGGTVVAGLPDAPGARLVSTRSRIDGGVGRPRVPRLRLRPPTTTTTAAALEAVVRPE